MDEPEKVFVYRNPLSPPPSRMATTFPSKWTMRILFWKFISALVALNRVSAWMGSVLFTFWDLPKCEDDFSLKLTDEERNQPFFLNFFLSDSRLLQIAVPRAYFIISFYLFITSINEVSRVPRRAHRYKNDHDFLRVSGRFHPCWSSSWWNWKWSSNHW